MIDISSLPMLKGKKALVTGIANDQSIAWGCSEAFRIFGADLALTYLNDKAKPYVEPLAKEVEVRSSRRSMSRSKAKWRRCSMKSPGNGARSTSSSTPLPLLPRPTSRAAWSTARRKDFSLPWTCRAGRSSAWPSSPSR